MSEKILDSNFRTHIQHLKSRTQYDINHSESGITSYSGNSQYYDDGLYPKLPTVEELAYGEIALNIAEGTETIAIKNNNGKIVFIPFNVAKRIQQLGQKADSNYDSLKNYTDERISVLSGNTLTHFDSLQELLTALSGKTANRFDKIEGDVAELSGHTQSEIAELKDKIDEHDDVLNGLTEEIESISQNVVEGTDNRLNELSAYTVSSFTQNAEEHEEIKASIASGLTSLSGQIADDLNVVSGRIINAVNIVSGTANNALEVAQTTSGKVEELSSQVDGAIGRIDDDIEDLNTKINNTGSGLTKTVNTMNESLGFTSGGTYEPKSGNLKFKNVTQSLDYIDKKLDEDILSGETRFINLMKIILEDEKVTANFAAIINHSCGFDINAQYVPATEFLKGLTVTEAIDLLYSEHIYKVESFFSDMDKAKLMASVTYDTLYKIAEMGCLVPGMLYRLTDYEAHVNTADPYASNVSVATIDSDHKFDIILTATSNRTLNENALAMYKPSDRRPSGDAFPESWEIKYTVYNDGRTSLGEGDETDKGKGVIFYMKDFYGNEAPFDFKSIKVDGHFLFEDGSGREASGSGQYKGNIIRPTYTPNGQLKLNNIRFNNATNCYGNEFKSGCENIIVEGVFTNNTVSPTKNNQILSGKENTFLGFSYE